MGHLSELKDRFLRKNKKRDDGNGGSDEMSCSPASTSTSTNLNTTLALDEKASGPNITSLDPVASADTQLKPVDSSITAPGLMPSPLVSDEKKVTKVSPVEIQANQKIRDYLWTRSFEIFKERDCEQDLMASYIKHLSSLQGDSTSSIDLSNRESVATAVNELLADREKKQWKIRIRNHDIKMRSQVEKLAKFLLWSDPLVKNAVSAQPYAALAWSGVSLILPVSHARLSYPYLSNQPNSSLQAASLRTRICWRASTILANSKCIGNSVKPLISSLIIDSTTSL